MCVSGAIPPAPPVGPHPAEMEARKNAYNARQDALEKRVKFTKGAKWVFTPDDLMWHGSNGERRTWDSLAPLVEEWEAEREHLALRKLVMNRILAMPKEELSLHLTMCHLSLEMASELGLTDPA